MNNGKAMLFLLFLLLIGIVIAQLTSDNYLGVEQTNYKTSFDKELDRLNLVVSDVNLIETNIKGNYIFQYADGTSEKFHLTVGELYFMTKAIEKRIDDINAIVEKLAARQLIG